MVNFLRDFKYSLCGFWPPFLTTFIFLTTFWKIWYHFSITYMCVSVFKVIIFIEHYISKQGFQITGVHIYTFGTVRIIRPDKRISKIPGVLFENKIVRIVPKPLKILNCKNCSCSCVAFSKRMNLPDICNKTRKMFYFFFFGVFGFWLWLGCYFFNRCEKGICICGRIW